MKIKNENVKINIGNKKYEFHNQILNEYFKRFIIAQSDKYYVGRDSAKRLLDCCFIKFDTPIEFNNDSKIYNYDFDICFGYAKISQTVGEKAVSISYNYINREPDELKKYIGKKITAIGFNTDSRIYEEESSNLPVCAILDTTNYNIYMQDSQEINIIRNDTITTDAVFHSNNKNKIPGPVHLAPYGVPQIIYQDKIYDDDGSFWQFDDNAYGILYSVGLSSYTDYIDKEFVIGKDIQLEINDLEIKINGLKNYLSTDSSIFTSSDIYPGLNVYPIKSNYKYIIFKYKVWQIVHSGTFDNILETSTDTGYYYYQAIPIDKFGKSNLTIKYERG